MHPMEARSFPLERLHDATLVHLVRCVASEDWRSLALTCRRLCHLVRYARTFGLSVVLPEFPLLWQIPASRAFRDVCDLRVWVPHDALQQGCWERLADALSRALERWERIQEVDLSSSPSADWDSQPLAHLAAPLAALQAAADLRHLRLGFISTSHDLPHLEPLTQLTSLVLDLNRRHDEPPPLILPYEPRAPLADMTHLRWLDLADSCSLTGHWGQADLECPLAFPPHITYLALNGMQCEPGAAWRHIAALEDLQELHLVAGSEVAQDHPSWGLQQLSGSLPGLTKLVLTQPCFGCEGYTAQASLPQLMRLLYGPGHQAGPLVAAAVGGVPEDPAVAAAAAAAAGVAHGPLAAAAVGVGPPVAADGAAEAEQQEPAVAPLSAAFLEPPEAAMLPRIAGIPGWYAAGHLMVVPPGMSSFSSLKVLQLPYSGLQAWGLACGFPHHWRTLAACTALQQLEGLHASQPPPEGVKFPGVTRLEAAVAASDALLVLAAFPALREVKLDVVLCDGAAEQGTHPAAAGPLPTHTGVTHLTLDFTRYLEATRREPVYDEDEDEAEENDSTRDEGPTPAQAAAGCCSTLCCHLPSLRALEVVWPSSVRCSTGICLLLQPPCLAPLKRLSSLVLRAKPPGGGTAAALGPLEVLGLLTLLSGPRALRQVELHMDLTNGVHPASMEEEFPGLDAEEVVLQRLAGLLQCMLPRLERLQLRGKVLRVPVSRRPGVGLPFPV